MPHLKKHVQVMRSESTPIIPHLMIHISLTAAYMLATPMMCQGVAQTYTTERAVDALIPLIHHMTQTPSTIPSHSPHHHTL